MHIAESPLQNAGMFMRLSATVREWDHALQLASWQRLPALMHAFFKCRVRVDPVTIDSTNRRAHYAGLANKPGRCPSAAHLVGVLQDLQPAGQREDDVRDHRRQQLP